MADHLPLTRGIHDEEGNIVVEFDTPNEDFLRGFQCGQLFEAMVTGFDVVVTSILAQNALMIMRMAEFCGYDYKAEYIDGEGLDSYEWLYVTLTIKNPKPSLFNGGVDFTGAPLDEV